MNSSTLLTLVNVTKINRHAGVEMHALRGINLHAREGEFIALVGPPGAGAGACLSVLGGFDAPTSGAYHFRGIEVTALARTRVTLLQRYFFGFVHQGFRLLARTKALECVELPLFDRGVPSQERQARAREAIAAVGLEGLEALELNAMTSVQRRRVAIAQALVTDPLLLLADEPASNLDQACKGEILRLLGRLSETRRVAVVMTTRDPEAATYASRALHFVDGRIEGDERKTASDHAA